MSSQLGPVETVLGLAALEGWAPTGTELDLLREVEAGLTRSRWRARVREMMPPQSPRPVGAGVFARRVPYLQRGSTVLENSFGVTDPVVLDRVDGLVPACAGVAFLRSGRPLTTSVEVHAELFADLYPWAGQPRIVELSKRGSRFLPVREVARELEAVADPERWIDRHRGPVDWADDRCAAGALASWYTHHNAVHPFREGNGRAAGLGSVLTARRHGRDLDLGRLDPDAWARAARESMPSGQVSRGGRGVDPTAMCALFEAALR